MMKKKKKKKKKKMKLLIMAIILLISLHEYNFSYRPGPRMQVGRYYMEISNPSKGLEHILLRHEADFAAYRIYRADLVNVLEFALGNFKGNAKDGTSRFYLYENVMIQIAFGRYDSNEIITAFPVKERTYLNRLQQ
eukprot:TRINITY_DN16381_c0_g1_i1.p1 TRINITY_DN16381_c0_g1~~TRINITY_DN16381_c0_g1_i1.p1  ORF type:complete len:136 (-),score=27.76 TRINITY_DN16381_c0_g1_i1:141-548(-)